MKYIYPSFRKLHIHLIISGLICGAFLYGNLAAGQTCPGNSVTTLGNYPNTYYPGSSPSLAVGATSMSVGPVTFGTTPIAKGDILLVIQMQGAEITANNNSSYGTGAGTSGSGYLVNGNLMAGNMEYVVANSAVPLTGGTLNLKSGLVHPYRGTAYDTTDGQYTYQVLRVPLYYDVKLGSTIGVPAWNGRTGGVMVLYAVDSIIFNGQKIVGAGSGFRGGSCVALTGGSGTFSTDYVTKTSNFTNGPKGEGIAGTPRWVTARMTVGR